MNLNSGGSRQKQSSHAQGEAERHSRGHQTRKKPAIRGIGGVGVCVLQGNRGEMGGKNLPIVGERAYTWAGNGEKEAGSGGEHGTKVGGIVSTLERGIGLPLRLC